MTIRHRFHEVMVYILRALMRAVPSLRENGDELFHTINMIKKTVYKIT